MSGTFTHLPAKDAKPRRRRAHISWHAATPAYTTQQSTHLRICQSETPAPMRPTPSTTEGLTSTLTIARVPAALLRLCDCCCRGLLLLRRMRRRGAACRENWVCRRG